MDSRSEPDQAWTDVGVHVLPASSYQVRAWRNGAGRTSEVDAAPDADQFDWRVSIADVEADGPFSAFPGVDRVIVPCEGPGMVLALDGVAHRLRPFEPFRFPGDAATTCRVAAPTCDLNIMTRRDRCVAEVSVVPVTGRLEAVDGEIMLAVLLSGSAQIGHALVLQPLDTVRLASGAGCSLDGEGKVAVVRIRFQTDAESPSGGPMIARPTSAPPTTGDA